MKKSVILLVFCLFILELLSSSHAVNVQGVLRDEFNGAVPDGNYNMTFRLFTSLTGGTPVGNWFMEESVYVKNGVYNVILSEFSDSVPFDEVYYLQVEVDSDIMEPRILLSATPYATALLSEDNKIPSSGNVGIGTTEPSHSLTVVGDTKITDELLVSNKIGLGVEYPWTYMHIKTSGDQLCLERNSLSHNNKMIFRTEGDIDSFIGYFNNSNKLSFHNYHGSNNFTMMTLNGDTGDMNIERKLKIGNTSAPQAELDVSGNALISGNIETSNLGVGTDDPQANLDVHGTVSIFGDRETDLVHDEWYTASSDGIVTASVTSSATGVISIWGNVKKQGVLLQMAYDFCDRTGNKGSSICFPVKKNEQFLVEANGSNLNVNIIFTKFGK